jgi:hypothetical protein
MAININCKKKWHPSRYETQKEVEKINIKNKKKSDHGDNKIEEHRRNLLNSKDERMSWMYDS